MGKKTEKNLLKAFEIEAKRRTEYDIYAMIAQKQGYDNINRLLTRFANHEKEHAKLWYKWLNKGSFPSIVECMESALKNEQDEIEGMYETFAQQAREDGLDHIAGLFENIENIEKNHYDRLRKVISKLKDDVAPNKDGTYNWTCSVCGAILVQQEEPDYCPLCLKEDVFFFKTPESN